MNVSLTAELEEFVQKKVESGRYTSASEVVREALRLLEKRDQREQERQVALRDFQAQLDRRLASLERGEGTDGEEVFERLRAKAEARRKRSA